MRRWTVGAMIVLGMAGLFLLAAYCALVAEINLVGVPMEDPWIASARDGMVHLAALGVTIFGEVALYRQLIRVAFQKPEFKIRFSVVYTWMLAIFGIPLLMRAVFNYSDAYGPNDWPLALTGAGLCSGGAVIAGFINYKVRTRSRQST